MIKSPERLKLPDEFPTADNIPGMFEAAKKQKNWWYDFKRVLQDAIEDLRASKKKFESTAPVGTTTPTLGTTAPAKDVIPYAWVEVVAPDGTLCVAPIWKKG